MGIEHYDDLAAAVIVQAALDYKFNLLKNKQLDDLDEEEKVRTRNKCQKNIRELETFFKSNWYEILTYLCDVKIPGREIIAAVKGTVKKEVQKCPCGMDKN